MCVCWGLVLQAREEMEFPPSPGAAGGFEPCGGAGGALCVTLGVSRPGWNSLPGPGW